jgi:hypothetical protein
VFRPRFYQRGISLWAVRVFDHTFSFLRAALGAPLRTFRYLSSGAGSVDDHVWRCGCAARETGGVCTLEACERHAGVNQVAWQRSLR